MIAPYSNSLKVAMCPTDISSIKHASVEGMHHPAPDQMSSNSRKEYGNLLRKVDLEANEVVVVDDYIIRGIAWGNVAGATTVWLQNGKFADLVPNDETGDPDFPIHSLSELPKILDQSR